MMLQTDGSRHDWLEGRGTWLTLVGMIDDANNEVPEASFREEEDAAGYYLVLEQVCLSKGIPQSLYADQHTTFSAPASRPWSKSCMANCHAASLGAWWTNWASN